MTENEKAIEQLERISKNLGSIGETEDWTEVAIKALEEVQQYRAIGTPEECRAAVEKQKPVPVVEKIMLSSIGEKCGRCPVCVGASLRQYDNPYCPDCGQKLDWSDEA